MTESSPKIEARPQPEIIFESEGIQPKDWGHLFKKIEFKAMLNGGYIVKALLGDPNFSLLDSLIEQGYLQKSRTKVLKIKFKLKAGPNEQEVPEKATKYQTAHIISLRALGDRSDRGLLEFIGIDPPSWYLNTGDGSGQIITGNVQTAIRKIVEQYAPNIKLDITETVDSKQNKWSMYRQDPKTFIGSLLDWSSSVTKNKTNWLISSDGDELNIQEQAAIKSKPRAFYRFWDGSGNDTIMDWELISNNALSLTNTKIITQGLSTTSGQYLDRISDRDEKMVFIKDANTKNKRIAKTDDTQSFSKPNDNIGSGPQEIGWTSVSAIPEIHSAGDMGLKYSEYIDGRPRGMYLDLVNSLMKLKVTVIGHGEWDSNVGLGVDTVFLKWMKLQRGSDDASGTLWFLSGNWIIYGFHHRMTRGAWLTDLHLARFDHDAIAKRVGSGS